MYGLCGRGLANVRSTFFMTAIGVPMFWLISTAAAIMVTVEFSLVAAL